jgi:DNA-binding HxlR family transcriptional regulator
VNPLVVSLELLGDRWTLLIVDALLDQPLRFGALAQRVDGIAPNVLTQRLRALQAQGLVLATPYSRRPPRFEYTLTVEGARLRPVIAVLGEWATNRSGAPARVHEACGTALETRSWCPTCERVVDASHRELHHF